MKPFLLRKKNLYFLSLLAFLTINYGCKKAANPAPGKLSVNSIYIEQTFHGQSIDIPSGSFNPDNPNFSMNDPSTWTGNMAQYVNHWYSYSVNCHVTNSGKGTAYDAELDLGYFFDNGTEEFETFVIGDISSYGEITKTVEINSYNRQLEECAGEVYWYNY